MPSSGMITYSSGDTDARAVGSTATYNCTTGFSLSGDMIRTCQNNGSWNGTDPTCEGKNTEVHDRQLLNMY